MRRPNFLAPGLLAAFTLGIATTAPAQEVESIYGRTAVAVPAPTNAGTWDGTWFYVSRDARMAAWLRSAADGSPEVKLQYFGINNSENFETDWTGRAEYFVRDVPGSFSFEIIERDANTIKARWTWRMGTEYAERNESATVVLYRTADGRRFAMKFEDYERIVRDGPNVRRHTAPQVWTFIKASKRLVRWQELPF